MAENKQEVDCVGVKIINPAGERKSPKNKIKVPGKPKLLVLVPAKGRKVVPEYRHGMGKSPIIFDTALFMRPFVLNRHRKPLSRMRRVLTAVSRCWPSFREKSERI